MRKKIWEDIIVGCAPIAAAFLLAALFCFLVAMCSCKPVQKIVEVEKWQHDTTTITDTIHVIDTQFVHDSIYITNTVTEYKTDSSLINVAWKYYTYDKDGNVSSLMDYTSSAQHGSTAHNSSQSASTSVSGQTAVHEETGAHSESVGHSEAVKGKEQVKVGLTRWQKFIQGMGYTFLALLVIGIGLGGLRLYGRYKRL